MFFVGATGQLLTLLLSVGLPMVILLSGNKSFAFANNQNVILIERESGNSIQAKDLFKFAELIEEEIVQKQVFTYYSSPPIKIKNINSIPQKVFWFPKGIGNKAPPEQF